MDTFHVVRKDVLLGVDVSGLLVGKEFQRIPQTIFATIDAESLCRSHRSNFIGAALVSNIW